MGYDWEGHKEICHRLYIQEGKSLEEVMEYMRTNHDFTPSTRSFQMQFARWKFPSKMKHLSGDDRLRDRVRELWEKNLGQAEMQQLLAKEGFDISARELTRLRFKFGWRLRGKRSENSSATVSKVPGVGENATAGAKAAGPAAPGPDVALHGALDTQDEPASGNGNSDPVSYPFARKRRKLLGQPTDPSKPWTRFPSEMTVTEARHILGLEEKPYHLIRARFQDICREEGVVKKTTAGPEKWAAVKQRLISDTPSLQHAFVADVGDAKSKDTALDTVCADVTKSMRVSEARMTLGQMNNVLGINPSESRALKAVFHQVLGEAGFVNMSTTSAQQWSGMKRQWAERCELVREVLDGADGDPIGKAKVRALELLAKDVVKRKRDEVSGRYARVKQQSKKRTRKAKALRGGGGKDSSASADGPSEEGEDLDSQHAGGVSESPPRLASDHIQLRFAPMEQSISNPHVQAPRAANIGTGQPSRLTPPSMASGISASAQMQPSPLTAASHQMDYMVHPYAQQQFSHPSPARGGYHHIQPVTAPYAIYLRLHPSSSFVTSTTLWIATMQSQSLEELRRAAVATYPSAVCVRVEGVVKDSKGGEVLLPVEDDQELGAYLAHTQGSAATFCVQLAWKTA